MQVSKTNLLRSLKTINRFGTGNTNYIGVQWGPDRPLFYRSDAYGYIESEGFNQEAPFLIVGLEDFITVATKYSAEDLDLGATRGSNILYITGTRSGDSNLAHVHTARPDALWRKAHVVGDVTVEFDPDTFKGINVSPFDFRPPVMRDARLMMHTPQCVIFRSNIPIGERSTFPFPRQEFFKTISNLPVSRIFKTLNSYWGMVTGDLVMYITGHISGNDTFDLISGPSDKLAEFPAARLMEVLRIASVLVKPGHPIMFDAATGVQYMSNSGLMNAYTIEGATKGWEGFQISAKLSETLFDALSQDTEETVRLDRVRTIGTDVTRNRMVRGNWEINFEVQKKKRWTP